MLKKLVLLLLLITISPAIQSMAASATETDGKTISSAREKVPVEQTGAETPDTDLLSRSIPTLKFPEEDAEVSLKEHGRLQALCFKPTDEVTHYLGATVGGLEESAEAEDDPVLLKTEEEDPLNMSIQIGAGVERRVSKNTLFDLDYRYSTAPTGLDTDTFFQAPCEGHHISAGMKIFF